MHPAPNNRRAAPIVPLASRQDPRMARILARSMYRDMTTNGLSSEQILAVTTELIGMITQNLAAEDDEAKGTA